MPDVGNRLLSEMLDRLHAALSSGPGLNCRPHSSRQRIDLHLLAQLGDDPGANVPAQLLSDASKVRIIATVVPNLPDAGVADDQLTPEQKEARRAWRQQQTVLAKLRAIAEDARTFAQDTGAHVLHVGFPLLSFASGRGTSTRKGQVKRVLAPLAFIPVHLAVTKGRTFTVEISCAGERAERVIPNTALLAWITRQTGKRCDDLFADDLGTDPYREIRAILGFVCPALSLSVPTEFGPETPLQGAPRADDDSGEPRILPAAVLGLFPHSNQSLIDDVDALVKGEPVHGPAASFVQASPERRAESREPRAENEERSEKPADSALRSPLSALDLVTAADPCQSRTVRLARQAEILVVHGPPGTGKSQTIANVIGDHLARGQRVLLVCDKRVALDVVHHRLDRLGLGQLCAVVHDAQSDQRELYRSVRDQLDHLVETKLSKSAASKLAAADRELQQVHAELSEYVGALTERPEHDAPTFHELMGTWFALAVPESISIHEAGIQDVTRADGEALEKAVRELLQRGHDNDFAHNPWTDAAGIELSTFLARPTEHWRRLLDQLHATAQEIDGTADADIPAFPVDGDVTAAGAARAAFGETLGKLFADVDADRLAHWARQDPQRVAQTRMALDSVASFREALRQGPLDAELFPFHKEEPIKPSGIAAALGALESYIAIAGRWYGFLFFGRKSAAAELLQRYGLTLRLDNAARLRKFLLAVRARLALLDLHDSVLSATPLANRFDDGLLARALDDSQASLAILQRLAAEPLLTPLEASVRAAMQEAGRREALLRGLRQAPARAAAIARMEAALRDAGLFAIAWHAQSHKCLREGQPFAPSVAALAGQRDQIEGILRVRHGLAQLPSPVAASIEHLLRQGPEPDEGWRALHKALLAAEIGRRLRARPCLQTVDGDRLRTLFERYRALDERKKGLACDAIQALWIGRQRDRLLATTGSRLNSQGAELRRRLFLRGERAMRLRQVIRTGAGIDDGDPLFDLRPVWMAGPSTVAELFPRQALFDLVIFDEASQCRLEEALPVLLRGQRVVIAGDTRQLPPTRFFESAIAQSEDDEPATDQELFEAQQSEADDLLSAALNLSVEQSYLDVHYRSRNAELIDFSNRNFYDARLQAIPGHPAHRPSQAAIRLHRVKGVYDQRRNAAEAAAVVGLVRELLQRPEPPSIGIACFNISQRDQIVDALDDAADGDADFAARLDEARRRQGSASFEGLFVRNLENVQGDERDCLIISTTYGPNKEGKFYRRFGPLGRAGGGRRLNVLVTRARAEVHLVTSFPSEAYRALPPVPPGASPNGGWLLFAYLKFAEQLERQYSQAPPTDGVAPPPPCKPAAVDVQASAAPSLFARALAERLTAEHGLSSTVHWGNEGFCVDVVLRRPDQPPDAALGVLCDACRFSKADDLVEWDVFRTSVLEAQGWRLQRLWTPHFMRDVPRALEAIVKGLAPPTSDRKKHAPVEKTSPPRSQARERRELEVRKHDG